MIIAIAILQSLSLGRHMSRLILEKHRKKVYVDILSEVLILFLALLLKAVQP